MSKESKFIVPELMTSSIFGQKDQVHNYFELCETIFQTSQKKTAEERVFNHHSQSAPGILLF